MNRTNSIYWVLGISLFLLSVLSTEIYAEGDKLKQLANKELAHRPPHHRGDRPHGRDRDRHRGDRGDRHRPRHGGGHSGRHRPGGGYYAPPPRGHHRPHRPSRPHNYHPHLPFGFARLLIHGLEYFYQGGRFYRPHDEGFVVVNAPQGAVVATLPYGYSLINLNGRPYYLVNNTYYVAHPQGYQVAASPVEITHAAPVVPATPSQQLYIYPQQGQTAEQQARDEYECHRWGADKTGFDPSQATGINAQAQQNYQRAMSACLEARGYTVK